MADGDSWAGRAGWGLTAERVAKSLEGIDLSALLDRIESEMHNAAPIVQRQAPQPDPTFWPDGKR